MSYSQLNQDIRVIDFYKDKQNGFFIEIKTIYDTFSFKIWPFFKYKVM